MEQNCATFNGKVPSASAWLSLLHAVQWRNLQLRSEGEFDCDREIRSNVWSRNVMVHHRVTANDRMQSNSAQQFILHDTRLYTLVAAL